MRYIIIGLTVALMANTAPAAENGAAAVSTATQNQAQPPKPAAKERLYCIKHELTGSRMLRRECLTKAEWSRAGVDVDHPDDQ